MRYIPKEELTDTLPKESCIVSDIPTKWILQASRIWAKGRSIHTLQNGRVSITLASRYHADSEPCDTIEKNAELICILMQAKLFFSEDKNERIGSVVGQICASVAKHTRPFFSRRHESTALSASFGGRTSVFKKQGHCHLVEYDIPSSYPVAAMGLLPIQAPVRVPKNSEQRDGFVDIVRIKTRMYSKYGILPVRSKEKLNFFTEGVFTGWYWCDEYVNALSHSDVQHTEIIDRIRFNADFALKEIMEKLVWLRVKHPEHRKTLKQVANQIIGMFAYQGSSSIVVATRTPKIGDFPFCEENGLWIRRVKKAEDVSFPNTYRPFLASKVWSNARIALHDAMYSMQAKPISCHVDCVLSEKTENLPLGMILKKDYGEVEYRIPFPGALVLNGFKEKMPGTKKE